MKRFACWNPKDVEVLAKGIVERANRALVDACHIPVQLLEGNNRDGSPNPQGTPVSEVELLDKFLSEPGPNVTFAVVGTSGFGKTHLLNWLKSRIEERTEKLGRSPDRKIFLIQRRHTSVPDIVAKLIEDLDDDDAGLKKIRLGLEALRRESGADLTIRYLNCMAEKLDYLQSQGDSKKQEKHAELLYKLIREPNVEAHLREGKIAYIVRRIKGTATAEEDQGRLQLSADDFDFPESVAKGFDPAIRPAYRLLSGPAAKDVFKLLNDASADAHSRLLEEAVEMKAGRAMEVIRERWREKRGPEFELILVLEDLARTENAENTLVKAWVESEVESASSVTLRTIFAATTGVYQKLEASTRTRMSRVYVLQDVVTLAKGSRQLLEFVSKYVAAVRERSSNACGDCQYQEQCFRAFGSLGGVGLYPFSEGLFVAAARSLAAKNDGRIPPRDLIQNVIVKGLEEAGYSIPKGTHPQASFPGRLNEDHNDDVHQVLTAGSSSEKGIAERERGAQALLSYGIEGEGDALSLPADIAEILDLNWAVASARPSQPADEAALPTPPPSPPLRRSPPKSDSPIEAIVKKWVSGTPGLDGTANDALRVALDRLCFGEIQADVHWIPDQLEKSDLWGPLSIDFTESERQKSSSWFKVGLPESDASATVLEARQPLLWAYRWDKYLGERPADVRRARFIGVPNVISSQLEGAGIAGKSLVALAALQDDLRGRLRKRASEFLGGREGLAAFKLGKALLDSGTSLPDSADWREALYWAKTLASSDDQSPGKKSAQGALAAVSARKGTGGPLVVDLPAWRGAWSEVQTGLKSVLGHELPKSVSGKFVVEIRKDRAELSRFEATLDERLSSLRAERMRVSTQVAQMFGSVLDSAEANALRVSLEELETTFRSHTGARLNSEDLQSLLIESDWLEFLAEDPSDSSSWQDLLYEAQDQCTRSVAYAENVLDECRRIDERLSKVSSQASNPRGEESNDLDGMRRQIVDDLEYVLGFPRREQ